MRSCSTFVPVMRRRDSGKKEMWPETLTQSFGGGQLAEMRITISKLQRIPMLGAMQLRTYVHEQLS